MKRSLQWMFVLAASAGHAADGEKRPCTAGEWWADQMRPAAERRCDFPRLLLSTTPEGGSSAGATSSPPPAPVGPRPFIVVRELEAYRGSVEDYRVFLERGRDPGLVTPDQYREGLGKYKAGILEYRRAMKGAAQ